MIYLNLESFQAQILFSNATNMVEFVKLTLKTIEYLLTTWHGNTKVQPPYLCIDDVNLHRAFLINQDGHKIISFGFEFYIKTYDKILTSPNNSITNLNYLGQKGNVTTKEVSNAFTILSEYAQREDNSYWGLNLDEGDISDPSMFFFEYLLMKETGYVRYDNDIRGEKTNIHPRYHLDVNYSYPTHYKIGLAKDVSLEQFMTVLDLHKKCLIIELNPGKSAYQKRIYNKASKRKSKRKHY